MDLTEFLLARVAEDEARAPDVLSGPHLRDCGVNDWESHGCDCGYPARVLAECEAKWRIVDLHKAWVDYSGHELFDGSIAYNQPTCSTCDDGHEEHQPYPCPTLRLLALPYADHPAYDEKWRPDPA